MRRVLLIGSSGAGKSTLARQMGERLGLPVVHLDACYWQAGWQEPPREAWEASLRGLLAAPAWVMDGNYGGTLGLRLASADTVVFLDLPRVLCLARVLRRIVRYHGRTRPDMAAGCPEHLDWAFLRWIWGYPRTQRPGVLDRLARVEPETRVVVLRSRAAVRRFLDGLPTRPASS
ncbi:MAG TPA: DNA topology modulation protein [Rhodothermales bacterium]|nr:DNA topology modulation protein [Rhodothermales bacterium]